MDKLSLYGTDSLASRASFLPLSPPGRFNFLLRVSAGASERNLYVRVPGSPSLRSLALAAACGWGGANGMRSVEGPNRRGEPPATTDVRLSTLPSGREEHLGGGVDAARSVLGRGEGRENGCVGEWKCGYGEGPGLPPTVLAWARSSGVSTVTPWSRSHCSRSSEVSVPSSVWSDMVVVDGMLEPSPKVIIICQTEQRRDSR